jgi:hypothetical protein
MDASARDLVSHESRLARRLERLFRLERRGALARRPRSLAARLTLRRGDLVTALIRADAMRQALKLPVSPALDTAMAALAGEVDLARGSADARLDRLAAELRIARGEGIASGLRDTGGGRLIGQG